MEDIMCLTIPDYMHGNIQDLINSQLELVNCQLLEAQRKSSWATVLGLVPYKDGDCWCVLYGDDIQSGICGFGESPSKAMLAFNDAFISR
jgi:hypothetical protein